MRRINDVKTVCGRSKMSAAEEKVEDDELLDYEDIEQGDDVAKAAGSGNAVVETRQRCVLLITWNVQYDFNI